MKTQNTQTVKTNASANNTPVSSFASYVAKVTDKKQASALKDAHKAALAKKAEKAQTKTGGVFALVAGTIAKIEHKHLKKAIAYHVSKGNLAKTTTGIKLTEQGAMLWNAERVAADPEKFQAIAAMLHGKGATIPEWSKQPTAQVNAAMPFPNMLYWGSFSTGIMRQAFAAIFAK